MLMVVFGAGASYDSTAARPASTLDYRRPVHDYEYRPPLANELFGTSRGFADTIRAFPQCAPILPRLQAVSHAGGSIEQELERLQAEAEEEDDPERFKQLAAVRYYLHHLLTDFVRKWDEVALGVTNYKTLLDDIRHYRKDGERVCLVTFNYDTLLDSALPVLGLNVGQVRDYVARSNLKVIKIHGSVNWAREIDTAIIRDVARRNVWELVQDIIERSPELIRTR